MSVFHQLMVLDVFPEQKFRLADADSFVLICMLEPASFITYFLKDQLGTLHFGHHCRHDEKY